MTPAYVVDTPILLDILENDPEYGASSRRRLTATVRCRTNSSGSWALSFLTRTCGRRARSSTAHGHAIIAA